MAYCPNPIHKGVEKDTNKCCTGNSGINWEIWSPWWGGKGATPAGPGLTLPSLLQSMDR